ncbi:MAG: non-canonical purine NTP pyrophosphatase, RdgB/HAM1 family [Candidatus Magasanikbacteria bacterium CG_4_10_14_0_8_um_filter_32_14]|uniref:dITP/XTP pyrophosphatase n=2 Tax=Candidatus Magasanikiibacteriota TaxID=1752731 RepID=A0A2M7R8X2_9BACT|nr:MAG: non-canonical purine NTP pyrophosphatase, RdgB/HAM1 family [Candidatus Magasanikbacteria bacterium CG1_02_32_51]PIY93190.1 MAG: non-canonical purine NTP pyrophosphatase, RdgB/HAM1 family [Candidatus Magasanikbacteria bacterium CG_4_10_14_0_8_um_filter_32_14]
MLEEKRQILIATTNEGKFTEIKKFLHDLNFDFLSLKDLKNIPEEPEESEKTIEGNAILKAKYYADKTGLMSLADDGGIFVDTLDGWPGVISARIGKDAEDRRKVLLEKVKDIPEEKLTASFKAVSALYNPDKEELFLAYGERKGKVLKEERIANGFGYDPIFYLPDLNKTYSELTTVEKNATSHRGIALNKIKYFLADHFSNKHIVVPVGIIIKEGKMLISKRNDPHNPRFHGKWELPGGSMEYGEKLEENVKREILEETACKVEIIKQLNEIQVVASTGKNFNYQVYLIPFVCKYIESVGEINDTEVMETKFVNLDDLTNYDFIEKNKEFLINLLPEIREVINEMSS